MTINIEKGESTPALKFNKIHLDELNIKQPLSNIPKEVPEYNIVVKYWLYAIDEQGLKHYGRKPIFIGFNDFLTLALELYTTEQDQTLLNAIGAIENALGTLIAKEGKYGQVEVV